MVHGGADAVVPFKRGRRVAELTGGELVRFEGSGHGPQGRDPVRVNLLLREFAERVTGGRPPRARAWTRSLARPQRALYVSSPIGLGHAWRDIAIADELRRQSPGLEIHWLAQEPVTTVLRERGETIHPASAALAGEAAHIDHEAGDHDLHVFDALRRLDEIFCANFMVFADVVREEPFDVWIADEAWEVDHFLHENPELKTAPLAWLTDFVGYLPMPSGGEREAMLTADYNAETIEHVERYPSIRDRAIFIGDADDVVPGTLRPRAARDPRLDGAPLQLRRLRARLRPAHGGRPGCAPRGARLRRRPALPRLGRRLGRRRAAVAARDRRAPARARARPRPAHGRRGRAADRPGEPARGPRASRCSATSTSCTGISRPATSRSCRAG